MIFITGKTSELKCTLFPPIDLSESPNWEMGFYDFATYNSIPNVEENINNTIHFQDDVTVTLPTGSYELEDINKYIIDTLKIRKTNIKFHLSANVNTLKSEIFSTVKLILQSPIQSHHFSVLNNLYLNIISGTTLQIQ